MNLDRQTPHLAVIHQIGRALSAILDVKSICEEFARQLRTAFGFEHVSIYRVSAAGRLELSALVDSHPSSRAPDELGPDDDSPLSHAVREGKTLRSGIDVMPGSPPPFFHPAARQRVCLPFFIAQRVLGVINAESESAEPFQEADVAALESLGDHLAISVNNALVYSERDRKARVLQTINRISKAINAELNLHNLFELIYQQVAQLITCENFLIAIQEESRLAIKYEIADNRRKLYPGTLTHDGLAAVCLREGRHLVVQEDFVRTYEELAGHPPFRVAQNWLGVPLLAEEKAFGLMVLQNFRRRQFYDEEDVNFLVTISDQAAVAIRNAHLFQEAEERATRLAVVNEITRSASLTLNLDSLFASVVEQLKRVLQFEKASIALFQPEADCFVLVNVHGGSGDAAACKGMEIPAGETVMKIAYDTRKPYYTPLLDMSNSQTAPYLVTQGIQSAVSIPIVGEDVCLGILNLGSQKEMGFSAEQIAFLGTIANSLGTALRNAHLYSKLEQSYAELKKTQQQLIQSEKLRAMGELSVGVAHDFNNLLMAILGHTQLLLAQATDPPLRKGLLVIEEAALEGASTIRRLQDFTRQRADQPFEPVNVVELLEETLTLTRSRWKDSAYLEGIQFTIRANFSEVPWVAGNSSELREVFANILINALEAMPAGGSLSIGAESRESQVVIAFTDSGVGMGEEVRSRVFDPFFTTKPGEGKGLGMSVAYSIISRHQGAIEIESAPGAGTTVRVVLPAGAGRVEKAETGGGEVAQSPPPPSLGFLVIDDEAPIRDFLEELLSGQGHSVLVAADGAAGMELFHQHRPEIVITDLGMPGMSGWEVAAAIKVLEPSARVLLMTGWGNQLDPEKARKSGIDRVLAKPFQIADIQQLLQEMIGSLPARP